MDHSQTLVIQLIRLVLNLIIRWQIGLEKLATGVQKLKERKLARLNAIRGGGEPIASQLSGGRLQRNNRVDFHGLGVWGSSSILPS